MEAEDAEEEGAGEGDDGADRSRREGVGFGTLEGSSDDARGRDSRRVDDDGRRDIARQGEQAVWPLFNGRERNAEGVGGEVQESDARTRARKDKEA